MRSFPWLQLSDDQSSKPSRPVPLVPTAFTVFRVQIRGQPAKLQTHYLVSEELPFQTRVSLLRPQLPG
ncbi:Mycobacterium numidiamassiliense ORFan [Mycobacterium numidiamassiliense]|uniref:Mycobacterium numidiamassiliense ORFan n=1 Tax=Mycobacterium numidiamassiliense TaxID=1841861 RepID=A0A2U3P3B7_9MYCO|nr:Mycobacterium numidiamassiliense ORFan [Mycobacterium numidiamassiliense]